MNWLKLTSTCLLLTSFHACLIPSNPQIVERYESFGVDENAAQEFVQLQQQTTPGNLPQAIEELNSLRHRFPDNVPVHRAYQEKMLQAAKGEELLLDYRNKLAAQRTALNLYLVARLSDDDVETAQLLEEAIRFEKDFYWAHLGLGMFYWDQNKNNLAETYLRRAVEIHPEFFVGFRRLAEFYIDRDLQAAKQAYKQCLKLRPNQHDIEFNLGLLYLQDKETDKARSIFEDILKRNPNYSDALYGVAACYLTENDPQAAKQIYERILRLNEEEHLAHYNLGILYEEYFQNSDAALQEYEAFYAASGEQKGFRWLQALLWIERLREKSDKAR